MQGAQVLPLVLMQAFDLHVEDGSRVHRDVVLLLDGRRQPFLVGPFDLGQLARHRPVVGELHKAFQLGRVGDVAVPDELGDVGGQQGVGLVQPPPVGDAVGHVGKLLGGQLIVVAEDGFL